MRKNCHSKRIRRSNELAREKRSLAVGTLGPKKWLQRRRKGTEKSNYTTIHKHRGTFDWQNRLSSLGYNGWKINSRGRGGREGNALLSE